MSKFKYIGDLVSHKEELGVFPDFQNKIGKLFLFTSGFRSWDVRRVRTQDFRIGEVLLLTDAIVDFQWNENWKRPVVIFLVKSELYITGELISLDDHVRLAQ